MRAQRALLQVSRLPRIRRMQSVLAAVSQSLSIFGNKPEKSLYLLRHGRTEMNEYLSMHRYDRRVRSPRKRKQRPEFKDPLLYDTRLTPQGEKQAKTVTSRLRKVNPRPELIVASPLTRALRTADLALEGVEDLKDVPRMVLPLASERLYHSSDMGRPPAELAREFPHWPGFDALDDAWWYRAPGATDPLAVQLEPEGVFLARIEALRQWLVARPEKSILVVAHWGVIEALTSDEFENCELRMYDMSRLKVRAARETASA